MGDNSRSAPEAILLCGPTASGKSDFALALAERWPIEIISVDSAQVYRGFNIGAAKPDGATQAAVPHHLIDIRDPQISYSAGEFVTDALQAIKEIRARGRLPVLVGGTMFYFNALVRGIAAIPQVKQELRLAIDLQAIALGWPALHAQLMQVDPIAAARIHSNDAQRIQRALEVYQSTGRPLSYWQRGTSPAHRLRLSRWALMPLQRELLHARITLRFKIMLEQGLVAEVQRLRELPSLSATAASLRAVGYRQIWAHLEGETSLELASERAIAATRQLAKRQVTWINADPEWRHMDPLESEARTKWVNTLLEELGAC